MCLVTLAMRPCRVVVWGDGDDPRAPDDGRAYERAVLLRTRAGACPARPATSLALQKSPGPLLEEGVNPQSRILWLKLSTTSSLVMMPLPPVCGSSSGCPPCPLSPWWKPAANLSVCHSCGASWWHLCRYAWRCSFSIRSNEIGSYWYAFLQSPRARTWGYFVALLTLLQM